MNANLEPISAPSDPQPYLTQDVENLPVDALERQIEIAEPIVVTPEIVTAEPTATEYPTLEPSATDLPTNTPEPTATEYPTLEPTVTEYPTLEPSATGIPVPDASATPTATEALPDTFEPPTMTATSEAAAAAEVVTEGLGGGTPTETPLGYAGEGIKFGRQQIRCRFLFRQGTGFSIRFRSKVACPFGFGEVPVRQRTG
jgi:hypothetical protein